MNPLVNAIKNAFSPFLSTPPNLACILGSGLNHFASQLEVIYELDVSTLPEYPAATVSGHAGKIILGKLSDKNILVFQGRIHFYEGRTAFQTTIPIQVIHEMGITSLLVTNAAGGINPGFLPGDLMMITDHLNLTFQNPLIGNPFKNGHGIFVDMNNAYDTDLQTLIIDCAKKLDIPLRQGVYAGLTGPSYESPSEVKMLGRLQADAVGMSTVHEVIMARYFGIRVAGISCITNLAAGISQTKLSHEEVTDTGMEVAQVFSDLVKEVVNQWPD